MLKTNGLKTYLRAMNLTMAVSNNGCVAEIPLPIESKSATLVGEILHKKGEAEMEVALVLVESSEGREKKQPLDRGCKGWRGKTKDEMEEPIPLNLFHPHVLDWIIQKA